MKSKNQIEYARMWPRELFYQLGPNESGKGKNVHGFKGLGLINKAGVYVLYRDGVPYYVGKANKLRRRLWAHAHSPEARYHNFWNHFSAFVIHDSKLMNLVEAILIAAMPTANAAKPGLKPAKIPPLVSKMTRDIYEHQANPKMEFVRLNNRLKKIETLVKRKQKP